MSCSTVGLYERLSAAFDRFFSGFRFAVGGRYVDLAHDLAWGVLVSGSTVLAEIARATRRDLSQPLISVEKRLSSGLASKGWHDERLADAVTRSNARPMRDRSLLVVDLTDLAKPYAKAMDDLCLVHDGSAHRVVTGFPAVVVFLERAPHDLVPLRVVPFSFRSKGFVSQTDTVFSVLRAVKRQLPSGRTGITIEDRGFDGDHFFEFFVEERWPAIVRLRGDRHVVGPWGQGPAEEVALDRLNKARWANARRACMFPVRLPDIAVPFLLVGYEHAAHTGPIFLLVYELPETEPEDPLTYARWYLRRWGGEDWIRLMKQGLGLERFMARSANARRRLCLAAELALTFATELGASGKRWVDEVKEAAESFAEPVESEIARLLRGIRKVGERSRGALEGREAA